MVKPSLRTKSITTKVTEEECACLEKLATASGQSMSECHWGGAYMSSFGMCATAGYNFCMPRPHHYYGLNHLHFVTSSTYRRARLFDREPALPRHPRRTAN